MSKYKTFWIETTEHIPMVSDGINLVVSGEKYFDIAVNSRMNLVSDHKIDNALGVVEIAALDRAVRNSALHHGIDEHFKKYEKESV